MYHQLFTRAQKFFIKKRKYFSRSKNKLSLFLMHCFYSNNFISDEGH